MWAVSYTHLDVYKRQLVGNVVDHGKRAAQDLKGVEAKAIALVFNSQVGQAQARGLAGQAGKRSDGVLGNHESRPREEGPRLPPVVPPVHRHSACPPGRQMCIRDR